MLGQNIGAVADDVLGAGPLGAMSFDGGLMHREHGGVGHGLNEVGNRALEVNHEGVIVGSFNAKGLRGSIARANSASANDTGDVGHEPSVGRGGGRIRSAAPSIDEVTSGDRITIRPNGVVTQVEGVGHLVVGDVVAGGNTGDQVAVGILVHQAFEQVAGNSGARNVFNHARVDRGAFVDVLIGEGLVGGQCLACHRAGSIGSTRKHEQCGGRRHEGRFDFH